MIWIKIAFCLLTIWNLLLVPYTMMCLVKAKSYLIDEMRWRKKANEHEALSKAMKEDKLRLYEEIENLKIELDKHEPLI